MRSGGMEKIMSMVFTFLAAVTGVYSTLILIRILLSWFSDKFKGKPVEILKSITDPYIDFWRRTVKFRIGMMDFSIVIAIVSLSFLQNVFRMISMTGRITIGSLLSVVIMSLWSIASFLIGFCLIVIILRIIAYLTSRDMYKPFWSAIDSISKPILYRFNRFIYGKKTGDYLKGMILTCLILLAAIIVGRIIIMILVNMLKGL